MKRYTDVWVSLDIEELEICLDGADFLTDATINIKCRVYPAERGWDRITPDFPPEVEILNSPFRDFIVKNVGLLDDGRGNTISIDKNSHIVSDAINVWLDYADLTRLEEKAIAAAEAENEEN